MFPELEIFDWLWQGNPPGIQRRLLHTWPLAHSLALAMLGIALGLVVWFYLHERARCGQALRLFLIGLRGGVVTLVVLVMMYGWMLAVDVTDLPDLLLILDDSASMLHEDPAESPELEQRRAAMLQSADAGSPSRWNLAKSILTGGSDPLLNQLRQRYNIKYYRLAATPRLENVPDADLPREVRQAEIMPDNPQHAASRLGIGLRAILEGQRGRPTAAAVLLTDGITTEGRTLGETANYARQMDVPLYLIGLGNEQPARDVRLADLVADDLVFVGDMAHFDFQLIGTGFAGRSVEVQLRRTDEDQVLAEREVTVGPDGESQTVRLSYRPEEVGDFDFQVEVFPGPEDTQPENNRLQRMVSVRDESIRILFVQEYPSFEYRYLKSLLERGLKRQVAEGEKAFELDALLQEADGDYIATDETATRRFPVDRETLFQYDVIIFGDVNPAFFSDSLLRNVADFVRERGGGLIVSSGPRHSPHAYRGTPLADVLPVHLDNGIVPRESDVFETPLRVQPTAVGLTTPMLQISEDPTATAAIWSEFPPFYWLAPTPELRSGARILLETTPDSNRAAEPVICLQFVGAGKVVLHLTDETYRWSQHPQGEQYYARYWLQTIRYLSRSKLLGTSRNVEISSDQEAYRFGEAVRLRVRFFDDRMAPDADDGVVVVMEQEGGSRRRFQLRRDAGKRGVFVGLITRLPEGDYRVWVAAPSGDAQPPATRFTILPPQGELARLEMDRDDLRTAAQQSRGRFFAWHEAPALLESLPPGRQVRVQSLPSQPVWNSSLLAALFVTLLVTEWLLRRRAGML
jgi:uncharacterized membrane protein